MDMKDIVHNWQYFNNINLFKFLLYNKRNIYYDVSKENWFYYSTKTPNIKVPKLLPNTTTFSEEEMFQNTIYSDFEDIDLFDLNVIQNFLSAEMIKSIESKCVGSSYMYDSEYNGVIT